MSDVRLTNAPDPGTLLFEYRPEYHITTTRVFFADHMHSAKDINRIQLNEQPASQWVYYMLAGLCMLIIPTAWDMGLKTATPFMFVLVVGLVMWGRTKVTQYSILIKVKNEYFSTTTESKTLAQDVTRALKQVRAHHKKKAPAKTSTVNSMLPSVESV